MTNDELSEALRIAEDNSESFVDEDGKPLVEIHIFNGFARKSFQPITCSMRQLAALVRMQCIMSNGEVDADALDELASNCRHKVTVV